MTDAIAIIPARGGSKRLPRKNILCVNGRPLIGYTIEAALASACFARVIVSTEDDEIAAVATAAGAQIHCRDGRLASDTATVVEVCSDVLGRLSDQGQMPERFACLLATAALRTADDIRRAEAMLAPRCDFVMAVTEYEKSPLQALVEQSDGSLRLMWPELIDLPRSEAPKLMVDNGSIYWCRTEAFHAERTFYGHGLRGYRMPRERSVDVDTATDLALLVHYLGERGAPSMAQPSRPVDGHRKPISGGMHA
jgi:pseudaminic acid cytidylyltransferase